MILKALIILFGVFAVSRSWLRYRDGTLTLKSMLFWSTLWALTVAAVLVQPWTSHLARIFGVGRGVDLLLFGAVLFLSYLCFRLYVRLEALRSDLTELVRRLALEGEKENLEARRRAEDETPDRPVPSSRRD